MNLNPKTKTQQVIEMSLVNEVTRGLEEMSVSDLEQVVGGGVIGIKIRDSDNDLVYGVLGYELE